MIPQLPSGPDSQQTVSVGGMTIPVPDSSSGSVSVGGVTVPAPTTPDQDDGGGNESSTDQAASFSAPSLGTVGLVVAAVVALASVVGGDG